jgi:hypothetical protein
MQALKAVVDTAETRSFSYTGLEVTTAFASVRVCLS